MPKTQIVIATHKKYNMPKDELYIPLQVGADGKPDLGYQRDNTGDNISSKNQGYCELTGLYWAWKNLNSDYIGLVHYRRHFGRKKSNNLDVCVIHNADIDKYLDKINVFVPKKRKYYIETLYSHYTHTHYGSQLDETRTIIDENCSEYLSSFDNVIKQSYGYMFNMVIMRKDYLDCYCSWLFPILFELEKRVDVSELSDFQKRFYGRISEIMLNVWLDKQLKTGFIKKSEIMELPYFMVDRTNWWKKGITFLKAKYFGIKYEESF